MPLQYDPEFAAAMAPMAAAMGAAPKLPIGDVAGRRKQAEGFFKMIENSPPTPNTSHKIYHAAAKDGFQIPIYHVFSTTTKPAPISAGVLHIHGGGMTMGTAALFLNATVAPQVAATGHQFFSVDYRLAPEHPHPTPVEDCFAALQWLHAHAEEFNIDTSRIAVTGESAGGGLAAGLALLARDRGVSPAIKKQILIYPMLDDRTTTALKNIEPFVIFDYEDNATGWGALLGDKAGQESGVSEYAAPARAENLQGLPSAYIDVGMLDIFRDEDLSYAMRLAQQGVDCEFHLYPGVPHGFEGLCKEGKTSKAATANRIRAFDDL